MQHLTPLSLGPLGPDEPNSASNRLSAALGVADAVVLATRGKGLSRLLRNVSDSIVGEGFKLSAVPLELASGVIEAVEANGRGAGRNRGRFRDFAGDERVA
jgi:hypothetical protein